MWYNPSYDAPKSNFPSFWLSFIGLCVFHTFYLCYCNTFVIFWFLFWTTKWYPSCSCKKKNIWQNQKSHFLNTNCNKIGIELMIVLHNMFDFLCCFKQKFKWPTNWHLMCRTMSSHYSRLSVLTDFWQLGSSFPMPILFTVMA